MMILRPFGYAFTGAATVRFITSPKYEERHAGEFAGRLNVRPLDTIDMMGTMVVGMVGSKLTYARLTVQVGAIYVKLAF